MAKLTSISSTLAIYKKVPVVGKHVAPHQYDPQGSAFVIFRVAANKISLNLSFYLIGQTYPGKGLGPSRRRAKPASLTSS